LVNVRADGGGAVVELAIEGSDDQTPEQLKYLKEALEKEARQKAEYIRQALDEREAKLQLQGEVKQLTSVVEKLIARVLAAPLRPTSASVAPRSMASEKPSSANGPFR
jgi:aminopeptidase C